MKKVLICTFAVALFSCKKESKDNSPGTYSIDFKSMDGYAWGSPKQVTIQAGECKPYPLQ